MLCVEVAERSSPSFLYNIFLIYIDLFVDCLLFLYFLIIHLDIFRCLAQYYFFSCNVDD